MKSFEKAMIKRRSIYQLSASSPIADDKIQEIIELAIQNTPTAFDSQSTKVVVLFNEAHHKLWDIVKETLRKIVPQNNFDRTEKKIQGFKNAYGTILYFDDTDVTNAYASNNPTYAENFPIWANQSNGMLQYAIWVALREYGLGANLQHYNPLIDQEVKENFNIPTSWNLIAQMPFGAIEEDAPVKEYKQAMNQRIKVIK